MIAFKYWHNYNDFYFFFLLSKCLQSGRQSDVSSSVIIMIILFVIPKFLTALCQNKPVYNLNNVIFTA